MCWAEYQSYHVMKEYNYGICASVCVFPSMETRLRMKSANCGFCLVTAELQ